MKKNVLMLCLLFAFSVRMIYAQTSQAPVPLSDIVSESGYAGTSGAMLPDMPRPALPEIQVPADKLTMTSSPNPFTTHTVISCFLKEKGKLTLGIRNMFGETVKTFEDNIEQLGNHTIDVTSEDLRPGVYTAMLVFKTADNVLIKAIRIVYNQ
ncbi:MAG: hypothetical protein NT040_18185 [Bacteroidetes bacterium]|nr:hypothetical protein [Bacteroidota bacterium]